LKIGSSAEIAKARTKSACRCSCDVIRRTHPPVQVNFSLKNPDLFSNVSKGEYVGDDWLGGEVDIEFLQRVSVNGGGVDAFRVSFFNRGKTEFDIEKVLKLGRAAPVEAVEAKALGKNAGEVGGKEVDLLLVLGDDLGPALLVNKIPRSRISKTGP
jgi:hypothetical protein